MPEGPSLVILKEAAAKFDGRRIVCAEGNSKIDKEALAGQKVVALRTWGKHLLIELPKFSVRIHLLMFGSYCVDERKPDKPIRLGLRFANGELNFYSCAVRVIDEPLDAVYDWRVDLMSDQWDAALARKKLRAQPDMLVCDAILDQDIFAGAGNIFKNEVLFRIRVHPLSRVGALPAAKLRELVNETHQYAYDFYEWKKQFVLRQHWLAHTKRTCPRCDIPFTKVHLGKGQRRSFFCENCQVRY